MTTNNTSIHNDNIDRDVIYFPTDRDIIYYYGKDFSKEVSLNPLCKWCNEQCMANLLNFRSYYHILHIFKINEDGGILRITNLVICNRCYDFFNEGNQSKKIDYDGSTYDIISSTRICTLMLQDNKYYIG